MSRARKKTKRRTGKKASRRADREPKPSRIARLDEISKWIDAHLPALLAATLLLALLLRAGALLSSSDTIYFDFLLWDERVYDEWARKLADGTFESTTPYKHAPLPAYVMAAIYKAFWPDALPIRTLNVFLGTAVCCFVFLIGREIGGRKVGLLSCFLVAIYQPFILYSIVPLKTTLAVLLFSSSIYLFLSLLRRQAALPALLLGVSLGLLNGTRGNAIAIVPLVFALLVYDGLRRRPLRRNGLAMALLCLLGFTLAASPFAVRNWRVSGQFALTTSQVGTALYLGNNLENPDPFFRPVPFATASAERQLVELGIEASRRVGRKLSLAESSAYWRGETIRIARQEPSAFLWKLMQKALVVFNRSEVSDHYHAGIFGDIVPFFKLPLLGLWLVLPLAMGGIALRLFESRKVLFLTLLFLAYASTLVCFFPGARFRLPLLAIWIPLMALGLRDLLRSLACRPVPTRERKKLVRYGAVVILFGIVAVLPVQATNDLTNFYNTRAFIHASKGNLAAATRYWKQSSQMEGSYSAYANLSLAAVAFEKQDLESALAYLAKVPDGSFAAALKFHRLGDIHASQGDVAAAESAYRRSLEINSGQVEVREALIRLYEKVDPSKVERERDQLRYIASFYDE